MTEEEREKLIEDMARAIHATEWDADHYEFSDQPLHIQNEYRTEARAALVIAEEAISKDYRARIAELEAVLKDATVNLIAAVSLLESGGKKGAPSNKMFEQMLVDYKNGVERARAALKGEKG